ncbi:MAG: D-tyrosyl-tRNA(Tyr) deacylase [Planctomycetaceae bacterium]|nr:D-tyrosyl-tRNA(Tyr) deacylase [Planctomycetaceae bacterium]
MRAVIQRVQRSAVIVDDEQVGVIGKGLLVLLGVSVNDSQDDVIWMAQKTTDLRIFPDAQGQMNLSVKDIGGKILVVSQFTLMGDCRKGRRPSFIGAARPELAESLYRSFVAELRGLGVPTETGTFQADMLVDLVNDGPVTMLLDSKKTF